MQVGAELLCGLIGPHPEGHLESGSAQLSDSGTGDPLIGVLYGHDNP